eukprot:3933962-Rhodomonas_salina.1
MRGAYVPRPVVRPEIRRDDPGSVKVPEVHARAQTDRPARADRQPDAQTHRHTGRQAGRQADRQTDRQTVNSVSQRIVCVCAHSV